jgi:hypothetical protein
MIMIVVVMSLVGQCVLAANYSSDPSTLLQTASRMRFSDISAKGRLVAGAPNIWMPSPTIIDSAARRAWVQLIGLGHRALPALLDHMTDTESTNIKISLSPRGYYFAGLIDQRVDEGYVLRMVGGTDPIIAKGKSYSSELSEVAMTRGDLAFYTLGLIVNRDYAPYDMQRTELRLPSYVPDIITQTRRKWQRTGKDELLASLTMDALRPDQWGRDEGALVRIHKFYPSNFAGIACLLLSHAVQANNEVSESDADLKDPKQSPYRLVEPGMLVAPQLDRLLQVIWPWRSSKVVAALRDLRKDIDGRRAFLGKDRYLAIIDRYLAKS